MHASLLKGPRHFSVVSSLALFLKKDKCWFMSTWMIQKTWSTWCSSLDLDDHRHSHTEAGSLQLRDASPRIHKHGLNCLKGSSVGSGLRRVRMNTRFCKGQQHLQLPSARPATPVCRHQLTSGAQAPAKHSGSPARPETPKQLPGSKLGGSSYDLVPRKEVFADVVCSAENHRSSSARYQPSALPLHGRQRSLPTLSISVISQRSVSHTHTHGKAQLAASVYCSPVTNHPGNNEN